jgi:general secretion pathway protein D
MIQFKHVFDLFYKPLNSAFSKAICSILLVLIFCLIPVGSEGATTFKKSAETAAEGIEFNFPSVDINVFIKYISELTGKNFVVDNKVKGKVSIISPGRISLEEAYKVFESVLEVHGYTTVEAGEIIKIIPSPQARTKNIKTLLKEQRLSPNDKVVTQLIPLSYGNAEEIKRLLTPLVSKSSVILAYSPTNTLIVTDVYSNIQRLMSIINAIDLPGVGEELSVIPLVFANAKKMEQMLSSIFQPKLRRKSNLPEPTVRFVADERTNTLILMASEDTTQKIKRLIEFLDKEAPKSSGKIHVYYLENANAEELSAVLQDLASKKTATAGTENQRTAIPIVSEQVSITADKATNSLIIMAEQDDYVILAEIIRQLDIPRDMVYIESLLMEVDVEKNFELGIDWTAIGETTIGGKDFYFGGSFEGSNKRLDISRLANPGDFALGVVGGRIEIETELGTLVFPNIGAIARAFQNDDDINILSTPQLLTMDNQEARITVGRNIPYQTQATTTDNETFNSFEYRDVGVILKITPHISQERKVRLDIFQEITSIPGDPDDTSDRPTTLKRSIETAVIVDDNQTIVIGGLIEDTLSSVGTRVPCLGNIPFMGWFFKSITESRQKTNLFIFLNPRVVRSFAEANAIYEEKREKMDQLQEGNIKMYEKPGLDFFRDPPTQQTD